MSEARLERVEVAVTQLRVDVESLKSDVGVLKADVSELKGDVSELKVGLSDLHRHMLVLHEDLVDRITALAPDFTPVRREFREADAALRVEFNDRLVPLEALVRHQATPRPRRRRGSK